MLGGSEPLWIIPATLAVLVSALLLVDAMRSRRDDLSNPALWLIREVVGFGPRLFLEAIRRFWLALEFLRFDPALMGAVLSWLCARTKSAPLIELQRAFSDRAIADLRRQLRLVEGVLFLTADFSRVTLSQPLRLWINQLTHGRIRVHVVVESAPEPEPPPEPEVVEPETLEPHEILGVTASATLAEIKAAYRQRIKECHPDRFAHLGAEAREQAEEWTKRLNAAYAALRAGKGPAGRP